MSNWDIYSSSGTKALQQLDLELAENMWLAAMEEAGDFDDRDSRLAYTIESLAEVYYRQANYDLASQYCQKVLDLYERTLAPDHPDVGVLAHNLAMLYHMQSRFQEAEPLYKKAMAIRTKALGSKHPEVIRLLQSYAELLEKTHRTAEAQHMRKCIEGMSSGRWTRSGHWTVFSATNIGEKDESAFKASVEKAAQLRDAQSLTVMDMQKKKEPAAIMPTIEQESELAGSAFAELADDNTNSDPSSAASREQSPTQFSDGTSLADDNNGQSDPSSVTASTAASTALTDESAPAASTSGSLESSSELAERSGPEFEEALANWQAFRTFAQEALNKGNVKVSETLWRSALAEAEKLGPFDPRLAFSLESLAEVVFLESNFEESETLLRRSMEIKLTCVGPDHVAVALCHSSLAKLFYSRSDYNRALAHAKECVRIYQTTSGDEHPDTACALYNLAMVYHFQKDFDEAEKIYIQALQIRRKIFGDDHPDTLKVQSNYEKLLEVRKEVAAARKRKRPGSEEALISGTWKVLELAPDIQLGAGDSE